MPYQVQALAVGDEPASIHNEGILINTLSPQNGLYKAQISLNHLRRSNYCINVPLCELFARNLDTF